MAPEESEQIALAGTVIFQNISSMIFGIGLFGFYILAFIISMYIMILCIYWQYSITLTPTYLKPHCRQKENNRRAHKSMIALLLTGFAMTVLVTCAEIASNLLLVKFGFVVALPGGLMAQELASSLKIVVTNILANWSGSFMLLIADTAIVWRAWALWAGNRLITWTLLIILLADIGVNIADAIVDTKVDINLGNISTNTASATLDSLTPALNLSVNIVATLLIARRAWTYHQSTRAIVRNKKTQVQAILLLMVESGAILGMIQLSSTIVQVVDTRHPVLVSPLEDAKYFFGRFYIYSAVLNPIALVILVQTGTTYEQSFHLEDVPSLEIDSGPNFS
ncbi:hypothetical protein BT96DRAFT_977462 [Gymnopus androsaceus JB14]|uniref:Uncharacterized protein n=1 Tax=Gymnopus androsaceus JB14 TaxID=1447944 RepID=A0A6A4HFA9_9AGAR|nr:hypothetical protein BT96DRAFT_977462 [Gymnopus androsaceus JB14]